jgi:hypothetical protein
VLPVGTDVVRFEKQPPNGPMSTIEQTLDGRALYTAPYKVGATPDDPAPPLDATKVYVPRQALEIFEQLERNTRDS